MYGQDQQLPRRIRFKPLLNETPISEFDSYMDRISSFPDEVLCHILSFLPTKHAVATSILSSRWLHLWSFLPIIDLDYSLYLNPSRSLLFIRFIDRLLSLNQSHTIKKFRLRISARRTSKINGFIQNVFLKNVVEMDLEILGRSRFYDEYLNIPHSESLKVLKIRTERCIKFPVFAGCFPSLREFDVNVSVIDDEEWIRNLFPCLPALEKLSLVLDVTYCYWRELRVIVGGVALKRLSLELSVYSDDNDDDILPVVVIDAPKLEYLRLQDHFRASYTLMYNPAISEVRLNVADFNKLLQGLVNAKFISASATSLMTIFSEGWNIPVLPSLTKLELDVNTSNWILLLHWLESCPNLKVLSLNIKAKPKEELEEAVPYVVPDVVPSCLSTCVKEINIKKLGKVDHEKILIYLLYNAKVLDIFTVDSRPYVKDGIVRYIRCGVKLSPSEPGVSQRSLKQGCARIYFFIRE